MLTKLETENGLSDVLDLFRPVGFVEVVKNELVAEGVALLDRTRVFFVLGGPSHYFNKDLYCFEPLELLFSVVLY